MMTCKCVFCGECGGSGVVWFSFSGTYLGDRRSDDLDEMELCPECHGSRISEECDECRKMGEEFWDIF